MKVWVVRSEYGIDDIFDSIDKANQRKKELDIRLFDIKKLELENEGFVIFNNEQVIEKCQFSNVLEYQVK